MSRVVVVGAGAAGTMAAIFAARGGAETTLLERTRDGGRKILISGGGRCNVLPMQLDERRFVTDSSPNLLRKMVRAWPLAEQRAFFEVDLGIPLVEEAEDLKVFPASHRARDVRDGLLRYAARVGVRIHFDVAVTAFAAITSDDGSRHARDTHDAHDAGGADASGGRWRVSAYGGSHFDADALIIATGGLSVPNTGSDGFGLRALAAMGYDMHPTYPALTPITCSDPRLTALSGVSLPLTLAAESPEHSATATGGFLFTHRGFSGPAALNVSHVLSRAGERGAKAATLHAQWTALDRDAWEQALAPRGARTVTGALRSAMPDRLAAVVLDMAAVDANRPLAELRREERLRLIAALVHAPLQWTGDEGYKKAEVTGGGVALDQVDARTMESKRHPGLHLCGEVLDAFGPIGGYNFLWAWATGRAAGQGAAQSA